jgi:hypothetical protein
MDIQSASVNYSQARLQEQAAVQVQAMSIDAMREQSAAVDRLLSSAEPVVDPSLGQRINLIA